uniref:Uncharacterized protein n=1 Tax=Verrucosispora sp. MS100047 TaxID=1410949 RepID=A0A097CT32_9ACTN|nr:hypothetical protein VASRM7_593 [Verrucosispora sp. MS100047]
MDHYADDLAAVLTALDLQRATLIGSSAGGGEVARTSARFAAVPGTSPKAPHPHDLPGWPARHSNSTRGTGVTGVG